MQQIFKSKYPILEACMNKGSTLPLAIAVYQAGGYPSLCSWTYDGDYDALQSDLDKFVKITQSNRIHISFDINPKTNPADCHRIVRSHCLPTIEIIYGKGNMASPDTYRISEQQIIDMLQPVHEMGTKIFKRIYEPDDPSVMTRHFIDGFCIKGNESAGLSSTLSIKETFLKQRELTPTAYLIPYGGIGLPSQVKEYVDLGCEMVGVGTALALSKESSIKHESKLAAIRSKKDQLIQFERRFTLEDSVLVRKQTALQFVPYGEPDDSNGTKGLVSGVWDTNSNQGHVYLGHAVDTITEILPCKQIIRNLVADL
jgi:NAD(P)H-dependent flavin oxidoreductase YrpB (nitropropane dioxygenase family)